MSQTMSTTDLIPAHAFIIRTGRHTPADLSMLASRIREAADTYESLLNRAREAAKGFAEAKLISDLECAIEHITDNGVEFVSLLRHAAGDAHENNRLEREVA